MKGEWVYGSMDGQSMRQLGGEDTMGQTESRLLTGFPKATLSEQYSQVLSLALVAGTALTEMDMT